MSESPTTQSTSSVQALMDWLNSRLPEGTEAEWTFTGGGCYAITVPLADGGELMISDVEGPLTERDLDSDDERYGWCVGRYDAEGDAVSDDYGDYLYMTVTDDETYYPGPMHDLASVVSVVLSQVLANRTIVVEREV